jgi:hypothetical protein
MHFPVSKEGIYTRRLYILTVDFNCFSSMCVPMNSIVSATLVCVFIVFECLLTLYRLW